MRRKSRTIKIGDVAIGGDNPVVVQSMTNTDTRMLTPRYGKFSVWSRLVVN